MSERWRDTYDIWKLRTPPEYETDDPPPEQEPGQCKRCQGSGWIVCNRLGRYLGAGPLSEYSTGPFHDAPCDACGGSGWICEPEDDAAIDADVAKAKAAKAACAQAARELLRVWDENPQLLRGVYGWTLSDIQTLREMATWDQEQ